MPKRKREKWPSIEDMHEIGRLLDARRYDQLVEMMTGVLKTHPRCWQALIRRARAHQALGNEHARRADYLRVIELTSVHVAKAFDDEALSARAESYFVTGNLAAARVDQIQILASITARIEAEPDSWYHWYDRARIHEDLGNDEAAHDDFSAVLALKPDIYRPVVARAEVRIALGRFAEALKDANRAKALNWWEPNAGFDLIRAECYLQLGDIDATRQCLANLPGPLSPEDAVTRDRQLAECDEIERGRQKS